MPRASHNRPAALMLQGTGSNVGKSLLVAGLARTYAPRSIVLNRTVRNPGADGLRAALAAR